jgi:ATP-dependent Clp protease protease subunit
MKRKFWNWIKNQNESGEDMRTLFLNGQISDETWFGDEVTPEIFRGELNAGKGPVSVWINSPGGDVFAAAQIYNMLMDYPYDVTVMIDGLAASAASVIAMAGTKVQMSPVAMMMIHNPATIAIGDTEEMKKAIKMLDEVKESIMNAYEIKSGLSRDKISRLMDAETWFNAKKAVELGFADEIMFFANFGNGVESNVDGVVSVNDALEGSRSESDGADDIAGYGNGQMQMADAMAAPVMFSRQAVMNSMLSKLIPPKETEEKRTPKADLEKRLNLLMH